MDGLDPESYRLPAAYTRGLSGPALFVYLDRVRRNVATILDRLDGRVDRWRPHVKTLKTPEIFLELIRAGARGFKCATVREARVLVATLDRAGIAGGDVLCAYPLPRPALDALARLARAHPETRIAVTVEDPETALGIASELDFFVDVNVGMDRTGVAPDVDVVTTFGRIGGERFRGIHAYEGHLVDPDPEVRARRVHRTLDDLRDLTRAVRARGVRVPEVVTSGTPAFPAAAEYRGFDALPETEHRLSPGTVVLHDARSSVQNPDLALEPAALVFARVVSRPAPGRATANAGSKAIAAEAGDPCAVVLGQPRWRVLTPSEEHLPLAGPDDSLPERGRHLLLVPRHVCPTVNLAESLVLVEGTEPLGVVPVEARAHDLRHPN